MKILLKYHIAKRLEEESKKHNLSIDDYIEMLLDREGFIRGEEAKSITFNSIYRDLIASVKKDKEDTKKTYEYTINNEGFDLEDDCPIARAKYTNWVTARVNSFLTNMEDGDQDATKEKESTTSK